MDLNTSEMYNMPGATINPNLTMQDNNQDLTNFFTGLDEHPTSNPPTWGGMDQFLDFNGGSEFPFPTSQSQTRPQPPPSFIPPQAVNPYIAGVPRHNGMVTMPAHGMPIPANGYLGHTATPSALMDATTSSYSTRLATGSTQQKRPHDMTENNEASAASAETPEKKPRKQRKKRSKQLTEAEANEKRQKFLDRNKVAAHKCRQRKKEWTDNLQAKAAKVQHNNEMLRMQIAHLYATIDEMKNELIQIQAPDSVHRPGCSTSTTEQAYKEFMRRDATGFANEIDTKLRETMEMRNGGNAENDPVDSFGMSRNTSLQSTQSGEYDQAGRTERNDSGVSVGGDTPEDASKTLDTPKFSIDEGVELGNGQNLMGNMIPNPRLAMWPSGPADLLDPAVYLGLST